MIVKLKQSETDITQTHYTTLFPKYNHSPTGSVRSIKAASIHHHPTQSCSNRAPGNLHGNQREQRGEGATILINHSEWV